MSDESFRNIGRAYSWLIAYYREVAQFCGRVRAEFELYEERYEAFPDSDSIQTRSSKTFAQTQRWLPCYHYQFFRSTLDPEPGVEAECVALLVVGIDHFDPEEPSRTEPLIYLARFGPLMAKQLKALSGEIVYHWEVEDNEADVNGWRSGRFREIGYTYSTLPISAVATLDDVATKVIKPLVQHDDEQRKKLTSGVGP